MFPTHPENGYQSSVTYKPKHDDMWEFDEIYVH